MPQELLQSLRASPGVLRVASAAAGVLERVIPLPESYSGEYLRVGAGVTYLGDSAKAKHELGFDTRPLAEGLEETLRYEMRALGK